MAVRKYRSVADMPATPALPPLTIEALRSACELMQLALGLFPARRLPGVRKFRTMEDANHYQEAWQQEQIRLRRDRRNVGSSSQKGTL